MRKMKTKTIKEAFDCAYFLNMVRKKKADVWKLTLCQGATEEENLGRQFAVLTRIAATWHGYKAVRDVSFGAILIHATTNFLFFNNKSHRLEILHMFSLSIEAYIDFFSDFS